MIVRSLDYYAALYSTMAILPDWLGAVERAAS